MINNLTILLFCSAIMAVFSSCTPETTGNATTKDYFDETEEERNQRMAWWREARLGMFIHWGLYAVPAGEWNGKTNYGEWIRHTAEIPLNTYDKFSEQFNPLKFNAAEWVRMAKDAGMKYIVITSKHHDGFCLFDSQFTNFDVMSTPFKRDILKELADACHREGIRLCFYHSIMDWHHPDYLPRRNWEKDRPETGTDYERYLQYMKNQLRELCTNYGEAPHVLWFDGEWENSWNAERGKDLYNYVRSLKPSILINNRVGAAREGMAGLTKKGQFGGDFGTPEQEIPPTGLPGVDWETCMTMNDNWGYNKADKNFKSTEVLLRNLSDIASKGGNFLLNVGPTAEGLFPQQSIDRLREIGSWMKTNGEAIYGTGPSPLGSFPWGRCTMKSIDANTRLYLHVHDRPLDGKLILNGIANKPLTAWLLADPSQSPLPVERVQDALVVTLPQSLPPSPVTIAVLNVEGKPLTCLPPTIEATHTIFIDQLTVSLTQPDMETNIRYTLDGSTPGSTSSLYKQPFSISESTTVNARVFRQETPLSGVATKAFSKVKPMPAEQGLVVSQGLQFLYYEGDWDMLPDFGKLQPLRTGVVKNFDRSAKNAEGERYGFEFNGFIKIPKTAVYSFFLASDDGSQLWLDRTLVVDNDRLHGLIEKRGDVPLTAGYHELWVRFFEKTGSDDLKVYWQTEAIPKQPLPDSVLFYVQPK